MKAAPTPKISAEIRRAIQSSPDSMRALAARYGINIKSVKRWRNRAMVEDHLPGPAPGTGITLSALEEVLIVSFRRYTLLPIDDCLYALQAFIPHLTRSSLYRCLNRYDVGRLPKSRLHPTQIAMARRTPVGHFRIERSRVETNEGPVHLYVASDQTTKLILIGMYPRANARTATAFLRALPRMAPYRVQSVLTHDMAEFRGEGDGHPFAHACARLGILHLTTDDSERPTERQIDLMERGMRAGTTDGFYYETRRDMVEKCRLFMTRYNFNRRLKALKGKTPYQFTCQMWERHPHLFRIDPTVEQYRRDNPVHICGTGLLD